MRRIGESFAINEQPLSHLEVLQPINKKNRKRRATRELFSLRRGLLAITAKQKLVLILLAAVLCTMPLWLGLQRVHSATSGSSSAPPPPAAGVTLTDVPVEALIGEEVKFKVTFKNPGNAIGYGPFIDLVLDTGGANITNTPPCPCDGITFVKAEMIQVNGGPIDVTPPSTSQIKTFPCGGVSSTNVVHPFGSFADSGIQPLNVPVGSQLVTIELPFGSYNPTPPQPGQPDIVIEVTAKVSNLADANVPLKISARSGFRYGTDALNNPTTNHPILSDENPPGTQVTDSTLWQAQAQTKPTVMIIKKEYNGLEDETATGPNYPRQYKITVDIADGQSIANLKVQDLLPNNMQYKSLLGVTIHGNSATQGTTCGTGVDFVLTQPPTAVPGGTLAISFCGPTVGAPLPPDDVIITFSFFIPELTSSGGLVLPTSCTPAFSKNNIRAEGDWTPVDPCDQTPLHVLSDVSPVDHTLSDKCIAIQKKVAMFNDTGASGPTPGDTLRYELNFQISDFKTMEHIEIRDILSDGQALVPGSMPTLKVRDQFAPLGLAGDFNPGTMSVQPSADAHCDFIIGGTVLVFKVSAGMSTLNGAPPRYLAGILTGGWAAGSKTQIPATGQIVFLATITDTFSFVHPPPPLPAGDVFVDKDDPLCNEVTIKSTVYTNVGPQAMPTPTAVTTKDDSNISSTIVTDFNKKSVYAVKRKNSAGVYAEICGPNSSPCPNSPNPPQEVRPGDRVTFRIEKTIPSSDAEHLTIEDFLPLPIFQVKDPDANGLAGPPWTFTNSSCVIPVPGNACLLSTDTLNTLPVSPTITQDTMRNSITFSYGTFHDTLNQPRKIDLLFTSTVTNEPFADDLFLTNEALECENNTFGVQFCQAAIAQVQVREPKLVIRKGVIATNNPNGWFTHQPNPATGTLAEAPTGVTFSLAGVVGIINSTDLAAGFLDSDLWNVDANDLVTFAITIENQGGHPAYDVKLTDTIPSCLTNVSVTGVKWGRGQSLPSSSYTITTTSSGFTFGLSPTALIREKGATPDGINIIVLTFRGQLRSDITPGCCDNKAELQQYASVHNGPDFVHAGFMPPFSDSARVCVNAIPRKSLVATSEAHTAGSNVAIGEIARYQLAVRVPEGGLLPNFQVTDALPAGMKFLSGTARLAFIANEAGFSHPFFVPALGPPWNVFGNQVTLPNLVFNSSQTVAPTGGATCSGGPITFNLGNIQNNDNDTDLEYIVIEFNALVCNVPDNQQPVNVLGTPLSDTFSVSVNGSPIATSNSIDVRVVEPNLTISKAASPTSVNQGGTVTYTVTSTNTGAADAFEVQFADTLPPGLTFDAGSVLVTGDCTPPTMISTSAPLVKCASVPVNGVVTITYKAMTPAPCQATITNQAKVTWTSLSGNGTLNNTTGSITPGPSGGVFGERNGITTPLTLNDYAASASATVICLPCVPAPKGMVAWWPMNVSNGLVNDIAPPPSSIFNNVGGSPAYQPVIGNVGSALLFGPVAQVSSQSELDLGTGEFSVDAWVRIVSVAPGVISPIADKFMAPGGPGFAFYVRNQKLELDVNGITFVSTGSPMSFADPIANTGPWYHVAVTVKRSTAQAVFYINGAQAGTSAGVPAASVNNVLPLWIGGTRLMPPGIVPGRIAIDELELFKTALTPAEVQSIFNAGSAGKCP